MGAAPLGYRLQEKYRSFGIAMPKVGRDDPFPSYLHGKWHQLLQGEQSMYLTHQLAFTTCSFLLLVGCQGHLPPLETAPKDNGPKTADVIQHVECELASVVNYDGSTATKGDNARLADRIAHNSELVALLGNVRKYHFVATAQISLEVTDTEGFNPSLSYLNASGALTVGLGGQLSGTQDRSLTINYAIDLNNLYRADYRTKYCGRSQILLRDKSDSMAQRVALGGDLGLADIISDGLIGLNISAGNNVYGSSGPIQPAIGRRINASGDIKVPQIQSVAGAMPVINKPAINFNIDSLRGAILFAPQSAGILTQGSVSFSGIATLDHDGTTSDYIVNWSGPIVPPNSTTDSMVYFSLSGNLTPMPNSNLADLTTKVWGYSPTVNLTGNISPSFDLTTLTIAGVVGAAANSDYEKGTIRLKLRQPGTSAKEGAPGGGASPAVKSGGGSPSSSAGGTSFGSLVDFTLVYGVNGGPNWTFKRFKGPSSSNTPLLAASRTKIDSLAITFVASCQDFTSVHASFENYWDSIGACDDLGVAQQQGASVGYQNNSLMILRNFLIRP